ncbi:MAG: oligopeptidase A, partial [Methyloprofundus sp.]|nr:oligopeptidase A [Methyloprofundus sp.]
MTNPLLNNSELPLFSQIKAVHVEPAIEQLLAEARTTVEQLLADNKIYTWGNLIEPLEQAENKINKAWSPVSHMNSVVNN